MMFKREIEIDVMLSAVNFFGKQNFQDTTYTEYKSATPDFVRYEFEHPQTRDLRIILQMDMFLSTIRDRQMFTGVLVTIDDMLLDRPMYPDFKSKNPDFDLFDHFQRRYGNDVRLDIEEVILWLQDNEFQVRYMGVPLDEVF